MSGDWYDDPELIAQCDREITRLEGRLAEMVDQLVLLVPQEQPRRTALLSATVERRGGANDPHDGHVWLTASALVATAICDPRVRQRDAQGQRSADRDQSDPAIAASFLETPAADDALLDDLSRELAAILDGTRDFIVAHPYANAVLVLHGHDRRAAWDRAPRRLYDVVLAVINCAGIEAYELNGM